MQVLEFVFIIRPILQVFWHLNYLQVTLIILFVGWFKVMLIVSKEEGCVYLDSQTVIPFVSRET